MKTTPATKLYFVLIASLLLLTGVNIQTALFSTPPSTITNLAWAASSIGLSGILFIYGLVMLIFKPAKQKRLSLFVVGFISLCLVTVLGGANFIFFFLILGFTGSG